MAHALVPASESGELLAYLEEINRYPLLTAEEEYRLAVAFRDHQDLEAAHRLVSSYLRYVVKIAREYQGYYGLRMMDLVQEGSIGLMQAVKRFDPDKGFRLATYAMWWIRAAIQEFVLRSWSLVKVGTTTAQRKLFFNLHKSKRQAGLLDAVEAREMARTLGVDAVTVQEMDRRLAGPDQSLNCPVMEGGEDFQDLLPDPRPNQECLLLDREEVRLRRLLTTAALATLEERERFIVRERIMADTPATLDAIGQRLGISRERVRQLEKRALDKMRRQIAPA
ncbi:MAG: RNA polymerase sigma factor RpoH [Magnetococcales bacterium]|nr:RNA polymerase sigma factor RpoH [Magnetococcales bacterium]